MPSLLAAFLWRHCTSSQIKSETYLVDEVGGFFGPAFWDFVLSDLNLLGKDGVSNFSPALALVGPPPEHALPSYDSDSEVVCRNAVVVLAHDFRCHVAWRARSFIRIVNLRNPLPGNAEVCQL